MHCRHFLSRTYLLAFSLIFFWGFSPLCFGQDKVLQDLIDVKDDTIKANKLLAYAKTFKKVDEARAGAIYKEALKVSQKLQYKKGIGVASLNLGYVAMNLGSYQESIPRFHTAISMFEQLNMLREMSSAKIDLAAAFESIGEKDSAIYYDMEALKIAEQHPFLKERARSYINIGTMYNNIKSFDKAIVYQNKAVETAKSIKDTSLLSYAYTALSLSYDNINQKQAAFEMARAALALAKSAKNKTALCYAYDQYANTCLGVKQFEEAIHASQQAIDLANEIDLTTILMSASINLAKAYFATGEYQKEIMILNESLRLCKKTGDINFADDLYELLAQVHYANGNYRQASDYYTQVIVYRDSAFSTENNQMIAEQEVKYKTAKKEKELSDIKLTIVQKDLALQKSRQQIIYSIGATILALLLASLFFVDIRNKKRLHRHELETVQREKELQLLHAAMEGEEKERSRIAKDLHDGVAGMLAAAKMQLSSLSIKNDPLTKAKEFTQAVKLLDDSCHEVRITSHNLMPEILMQHGLDEALRRFCRNISNDQVLQVEYASYGSIGRFVLSFELTVYRIVQELLNNIVKHSKAPTASVQLSVQKDFLTLTIEDNGVGFDKKHLQQNGTGLNSLKRRLQALNGTLEIDARPEQGVTAFIEINISNYKLKPHTLLESV